MGGGGDQLLQLRRLTHDGLLHRFPLSTEVTNRKQKFRLTGRLVIFNASVLIFSSRAIFKTLFDLEFGNVTHTCCFSAEHRFSFKNIETEHDKPKSLNEARGFRNSSKNTE